MNKFEKAVSVSALSMGISAGFLYLDSELSQKVVDQRQECYEKLEGQDETSCLADVSSYGGENGVIQLFEIAGLLGAVASGVVAYRALNKEPDTKS